MLIRYRLREKAGVIDVTLYVTWVYVDYSREMEMCSKMIHMLQNDTLLQNDTRKMIHVEIESQYQKTDCFT